MPSFGVPFRNGLPLGLGSVIGFGRAPQFSPLSLFAGGIQGTWYDPSDLSTLFQDSAGTTPVTGVEQVVGRMLDKSGNGNHATATGAARPTLRARYNLLTYSEEFDQGVWAKYSVVVDANVTTDPFGGNNADQLKSNSTTNSLLLQQAALGLISGATYNRSVYAKANAISTLRMQISGTTEGTIFVQADLANGTATNGGVIENVGNGWWRISRTFIMSGTTNDFYFVLPIGTAIGNGVFIFGAQLLTAADAFATGNRYQRIAAATNYDTTGFLPYLAFGGTQAMSSGVLSNFITASAYETCIGGSLTAAAPTNSIDPWKNASCFMDVSDGYAAFGNVRSFNTIGIYNWDGNTDVVTQSLTPPSTFVLSGRHDAGNIVLSLNNGTESSAASGNTQSLGKTTTIMSNGSASITGRLYSMIIRNTVFTAAERAATIAWVNQRTGAY